MFLTTSRSLSLTPPYNNPLNQTESLTSPSRSSPPAFFLSFGPRLWAAFAVWRRSTYPRRNPLSGLCRLWEYPLDGMTRDFSPVLFFSLTGSRSVAFVKTTALGRAGIELRRLPSPDGDCRLERLATSSIVSMSRLERGSELSFARFLPDEKRPRAGSVQDVGPVSMPRDDLVAPRRVTPPNNPLNLTDPLPSLERDSAAHMSWIETSAEYAAFLIWRRP